MDIYKVTVKPNFLRLIGLFLDVVVLLVILEYKPSTIVEWKEIRGLLLSAI